MYTFLDIYISLCYSRVHMKENLTNRVNELRAVAEMTQEDLGKAVGVTRQTIIAIEKGNYTPSVTLALKLATFFKKNVDDIFILRYEK